MDLNMFFLLILEREGKGRGDRERQRDIDQFPPAHALKGDQTGDLWVHGKTLQW